MLMGFAMREQQRMEFLFFKQSVYWNVTIYNSNTTILKLHLLTWKQGGGGGNEKQQKKKPVRSVNMNYGLIF